MQSIHKIKVIIIDLRDLIVNDLYNENETSLISLIEKVNHEHLKSFYLKMVSDL